MFSRVSVEAKPNPSREEEDMTTEAWPRFGLLTEVRDNLDCGGLRSSTAIEKWRGVVHHVYVESLVQGVIYRHQKHGSFFQQVKFQGFL